MSTRNFKLVGAVDGECTGTITLNGVEVFNGTFTGNDWATGTRSNAVPMCSGSMTFDDTSDVTMSVSVQVSGGTGTIVVGMFQWDQDLIVNPALSPEELAYIDTPSADIPADIRTSVNSKGGFYIPDASTFGYGLTPETCLENRSNFALDGSAITPGAGYGIFMDPVQTLTFDTLVFKGPQA